MSRSWLLTSTFYGNWLPGDPRGFVTRVRDQRPDDEDCLVRLEHDLPGTPYDEDLPGLWKAALSQMRGPRVRIDQQQAELLASQFHETAAFRGWSLLTFAIMFNHVHWVVTVPGDPDPSDLLRDFKSYGSRVLNRKWGEASEWNMVDGERLETETENRSSFDCCSELREEATEPAGCLGN